MLCSRFLLLNFRLFLHASPVGAVTTPTPAPRLLNVTTIAGNVRNESVLECWQLTAPFVASLTAGVSGAAVAPEKQLPRALGSSQLGLTGACTTRPHSSKLISLSHSVTPVSGDLKYFHHRWVAFLAGTAVKLDRNSRRARRQAGSRPCY